MRFKVTLDRKVWQTAWVELTAVSEEEAERKAIDMARRNDSLGWSTGEPEDGGPYVADVEQVG